MDLTLLALQPSFAVKIWGIRSDDTRDLELTVASVTGEKQSAVPKACWVHKTRRNGCQVRWRGLLRDGYHGLGIMGWEEGFGSLLVGDDAEGAELAIGPEEEVGSGRERDEQGGDETYQVEA